MIQIRPIQSRENSPGAAAPSHTLTIHSTTDFELTGDGSNPAWAAPKWQPLTRVGKGQSPYKSRVKVLYSKTGLYFFFDNEDRKLTATMVGEYMEIFNEDVVEVFLWPDEDNDLYLEYELSPLETELPLLIANNGKVFTPWIPWQYEGRRRARKATAARGGPKASMAQVKGWTAEFFIPFALMYGLGNTPPQAGSVWRGNFYRIDYDLGPPTHWAWCPDTSNNFHRFKQFGTIRFGK